MKENKEDQKPHGFCVTPDSKCTMNYCDDNGCIERKRHLVDMMKTDEKHGMYDAIKVTDEQLAIINSSEVLKLNENFFIRKEQCLEILQKWDDKLNAEKIQPLQARIAELEADNKTWESLENDRAEEIGKLMARVTELEKEIADWFLTVSERDEQIERLREDIALLEKELSNTETALDVTCQKWREYCQRYGLEGL